MALFHVFVPHQLLHGANVIPVGQEMRGERMAEGVAARPLAEPGLPYRSSYSLLHDGSINVIPSLLSCFGICPAALLWENPLPAFVARGIGVFAVHSIGHLHTPSTIAQVFFLNRFAFSQMALEGRFERVGQHRHSVLCAFTPHRDRIAGKVKVLNLQAHAFHQAQTRPIHQRDHQPLVTSEAAQNRLDLLGRHDDGQPCRLPGSNHRAQVATLAPGNIATQEQ